MHFRTIANRRISGLLLLFLMFGCQEAQSQKPQAPAPKVDALDQSAPALKPILPSAEVSELDCPLLVLGWSADGKIAYLERQAREASDEDYYHFIIQNLKSDSQVVAERFIFPDYREFPQVLKEKGDQISAALNTHRIEAKTGSVSLFPGVFGQYREYYVTATIETTSGVSQPLGFEGVSNGAVYLMQNGKDRKRIDNRKYGDYYPLAVSVAGYLKSPFEDRIAVLMCKVQRGWEGPPNTRRFYLIGAGVGKQF